MTRVEEGVGVREIVCFIGAKRHHGAWVEYVTFNSTLHMERQVALVWHRLHRLQVLFKRFGNIDKQHFNVSVVVRQHQVGSA